MIKSSTSRFKVISILLFALLFSGLQSFAQPLIQEEITEGREYWFGLPYCAREDGEAIRGQYPILIWISSKVDTRATVSDAETGTKTNYVIRANQITQVPYGDAVMNRPPFVEEPKNFGINITADDPISVVIYMSYRWSGEALRVTPVEWLGKKYVTLCLYLDKTDKYKPGQILITATDDNTKVDYIPTAPTEKYERGQKASVTLMKGQTYLILGRIKGLEGLVHDISTDLTGTYITSNKPIQVISGHSKGAFPRYQATMLGRPGNFMRNMMTDAMWPIELLGTDYISAPLQYNPERIRGQIQDDKGDLIRFVASEDKTKIMQMRQDGTGFMTISRELKRGEYHDIINQEKAAYYRATKPVLAGQYGKTWWNYAVTPGTDKNGDDIQNPSRNGQGMLVTLTPIERYTSYATFRAPESIDNFVYLTFKAEYMNKLKYDGVPFSAKFGNAIKYLEGTEYAYITQSISAGDHWIEGDYLDETKKAKAVFTGYAYGNWDRSKDGFAYGYPIGMNYNTPCEDSLTVQDAMECGTVTGVATALPPTAECAGIYSIIFREKESENYNFWIDPKFVSGDKKANFKLEVIDPRKPAKGVIKIQTRSGKTMYKTYEYTPEQIAVQPLAIDFGRLKEGEKVCKTFTFSNPGTVPVTVKDIKLKFGKSEFVLDKSSIPFTLQPGETKDIEVCATALVMSSVPVRDTVIAVLSCYEEKNPALELRTGEPIVWIGDADWGEIPINVEMPKMVQIINQSDFPVELYSIEWNDKLHFTRTDLPFPNKIVIEPRKDYWFTVWYKADVPGVKHTDRAIFKGNTEKVKLYSDWVGAGLDAGPFIQGYDWQRKRVIDQWAGVTHYTGTMTIDNVGGNAPLQNVRIVKEDDPDDVFYFNPNDVPGTLQPNNPITVPATFAPKEEKVYKSKVTLIATFNGEEKKASGWLEGIGILPHIKVTGHEFQPPILVGKSLDNFGRVEHVNLKPGHEMPLTIFDLKIEGPDKDAFEIDQDWYNNTIKGKNLVINISDGIDVPIKFTAKHPGKHTAELVAESDAPDYARDYLYGYGYLEGLLTTDWDHGKIFKTLSNLGVVYLVNLGDKPITIAQDITASIQGDFNNFYIQGLKRASDGETNLKAPFTLASNDTLFVTVKFTPDAVRTFNAQIEYKLSDGKVAYSKVVGEGMILKTIARIPKDKYRVNPGEPVNYIEFLIDQHPDEQKALEQANITDFKAIIHFKSEGRFGIQDVFPDVKSCTDLITAGTMTEGWTCEYAEILNNQTLMVHMSNNQPLKFSGSSGTLFKFRMLTFLSDLDLIPLPCEFQVLGVPSGYVEVEEKPGDIKINPVCVNTARLIEISGFRYSLSQSNPNPASNTTSIDYEVGLESHTTISLYNSAGEKVTTLINQTLKPGQYTLTIDLNALGLSSGVYHYKIESGPFSDSKAMIIVK
ncbi:MAG: choice-of-anchor D domain-containing protein [Candidatus Kapabacteria bacterium]|nr:choice-of-anchor D domain-containing protein [Candidatus Kapabacteria bacterium]